ncbi:hypothetical protein P4050_11910 [Pseudomonas aeruginosa]|nr:hypothetical protein [Pseudomonas aeruginosa]MDF5999244.1 hypothetical protein [Pseudomonas aeruginosa]
MINPIAQMEAFKAAQEKAEIEAAEAEARNLLIRHLVDIGTPSMKAKRRADISLMWAFRKHLRKPLRNPKAPVKQAFPPPRNTRKLSLSVQRKPENYPTGSKTN